MMSPGCLKNYMILFAQCLSDDRYHRKIVCFIRSLIAERMLFRSVIEPRIRGGYSSDNHNEVDEHCMSSNNNAEKPWIPLFMGILLTIDGLHTLITGKGGEVRGFPVVDWAGWVFLPVGVIIIVLSIRSICTWKEPEPPTYTDEDIRQAKKKLEQMHLREHGGLPEAPKPEAPKLEAVKPEAPDKGK